MKRLNPDTGKPFKKGDIREDGYVFSQYNFHVSLKKNGFYFETWRHPDKHKSVAEYHKAYSKTEKRKTFFRQHCSKWSKNNKAKRNAITAKRHASKLQRTLIWLTKEHYKQIADFYKKAKELDALTGIKHHVDHIVPLQGENVSGLHVPWNLQILTAAENCSKNNSFNTHLTSQHTGDLLWYPHSNYAFLFLTQLKTSWSSNTKPIWQRGKC